MSESSLAQLFNPQTIAVVGVSSDPTKLGSVIFKNILDAGYRGRLIPVNPKYQEIMGHQAMAKVSDIEGEVDLVVVVVPAKFASEVVQDAANKQVKHCVIITAGFGETGEEGLQLEQQVVEIASSAGMRILGPNCLGLTVPKFNLDASFAAQRPLDGNVAFISQSGAFNTAMLDLAADQKLGFSHFVSIGNKSDLNELDFISEWISDPEVKIIGMYIEEFADGQALVDLVAKTGKPVVILHPGESEEAQEAIASHTGSLAGSAEVVKAALRKAGAIQVGSIEKMFNVLKGISWSKAMTGEKVAVVTNAGGPGIMVTDMLSESGVSIPGLSEQLQAQLMEVLPETASAHNPIDLIGDALAERYANVFDILEQSSEVDTILAIVTPQHVTQIEETAKAVIKYSETGNKPVMAVFFGSERAGAGLELLDDAKVPGFAFAEEAVFVLGKVREYGKFMSLAEGPIKMEVQRDDKLQAFVTDVPTALPQNMLYEITEGLAFDFPEEDTIDSFQQAINFVSEHSYPVVLKASTEDIAHKTDEKALYLNIDSADKLESAFNELRETVKNLTGKDNAKLLIQKQITGGEELIVGITRDGDSNVYEPEGTGFGHLIVVGKGGIYTEVYKDTATALSPVSRRQLREMVMATNVSKVLMGTRGQPPLALDKLIDTLDAAQQLVVKYPEIEQLDINPVIVTQDRCLAVDMKVFVKR